ncbi:hypothetical protein ACTMTJ_35870 [Phytohabitans sp. LJ34]|uniref:hypothetical protein n=1 Tax=Phytohabitans sp. LJ34 TaxID=3452217 RepID=UPI003F8978F7
MPSEVDLLRSLDAEPRTPSTVDIRRAIADGRRHRVRRGVGYAGAATVTALAVAGVSVAGGLATGSAPQTGATGEPPPTTASAVPKGEYTIPGTPDWRAPVTPPPTSCTLEQLPTPDGEPMALISGGDPTGRYHVGRSYPKGGGYQAVIWNDGAPKKVMLPGDLEESLRDVNSSGTAVGWSYAGGEDDSGPVPYAYHDGEVSKLPGVRRGSASAINEAGAIVGDDDAGHALVWPSPATAPIRLPVPAGTKEATAVDIDEDGTTVGNVGNNRAYVWFPDGTHRALPVPDLDGKPGATTRVFAIRNGWATGLVAHEGAARGIPGGAEAAKSGGGSVPIRWNVRTGEVIRFDGLTGPADAVNAQGWQVGIGQRDRAVLLAGDATVVLPDLGEPGNLATIANTLSDDGRTVAGQSDDSTDTIQAVVWHCE